MLFIASGKGQGLVEYALILLFIALALIVILELFGNEVIAIYSTILDQYPGS